jgi:predicted transcriptional regulator
MAKKPPTEHPLKTWLAGQEMSVSQFAAEAEIPWRTLYDSINGVSPKLDTMLAIEGATAGQVSVQDQADWFGGRK